MISNALQLQPVHTYQTNKQTCIFTAIIIDCSSASSCLSNERWVNVRLQSLSNRKHTNM